MVFVLCKHCLEILMKCFCGSTGMPMICFYLEGRKWVGIQRAWNGPEWTVLELGVQHVIPCLYEVLKLTTKDKNTHPRERSQMRKASRRMRHITRNVDVEQQVAEPHGFGGPRKAEHTGLMLPWTISLGRKSGRHRGYTALWCGVEAVRPLPQCPLDCPPRSFCLGTGHVTEQRDHVPHECLCPGG